MTNQNPLLLETHQSKYRITSAVVGILLGVIPLVYFYLTGTPILGEQTPTHLGLAPPETLLAFWVLVSSFAILFSSSTRSRWGLATMSSLSLGGIVVYISPSTIAIPEQGITAYILLTTGILGIIGLYEGCSLCLAMIRASDKDSPEIDTPTPQTDTETAHSRRESEALETENEPVVIETDDRDAESDVALPPKDATSPLEIANNPDRAATADTGSKNETSDEDTAIANSDHETQSATDAATDPPSQEDSSMPPGEDIINLDDTEAPEASDEQLPEHMTDGITLDVPDISEKNKNVDDQTEEAEPSPESGDETPDEKAVAASTAENSPSPELKDETSNDNIDEEAPPSEPTPDPEESPEEEIEVDVAAEAEPQEPSELDTEFDDSPPETAETGEETDEEEEEITTDDQDESQIKSVAQDKQQGPIHRFINSIRAQFTSTDSTDASGVDNDQEKIDVEEDQPETEVEEDTPDEDETEAPNDPDEHIGEIDGSEPSPQSEEETEPLVKNSEEEGSEDFTFRPGDPSESPEPEPKNATESWRERINQAAANIPGLSKVLPFEAEDDEVHTQEIEDAGREVIQQLTGPESIQVDANKIHASGRYSRTFTVTDWPREVKGHFLYELYRDTRLEFNMAIHADPKDRKESIKKLSDIESKLSDKIEGDLAEYLPNIDATEQTRNEVRELKRSIENEGVRMYDASIYLTIYAETEEELNDYERMVREHLEIDAGLDTERATEYLDEAWISSGPLAQNLMAENREKATQYSKSSQIAHLFPFIEDTVMEEDGIVFGDNLANGTPIILDIFNRNNGYNKLVIGEIGSGKSFGEGTYLLRHRMRHPDDNITIIDPMGGFIGVNEAMGGERIVINGQKTMNPLEIKQTPMKIVREKNLDPWNMKINEVKWFFHMYFESFDEGGSNTISPQQWAPLMRAVKDAYRDKGITPDPKTHSKESPTIQHVLDNLSKIAESPEEYAKSEAKREIDLWSKHASEVLMALEAFQPGGELDNLVGQTEFEISADKPTYIDMEQLEGRGGTLDIMLRIMFNIVYEQAKETDARSVIAIDEAHKIIGDGSDQNASHWEEIFRHSRHHDLSIHLLSQEFEDFFQTEGGEGANEAAKTMASLCTVRRIHRVNNVNRKLAKEGLELTDAHCSFIENAVSGEDESRDYTTALLDIQDLGKVGVKVKSYEEEVAAISYDGEHPSDLDDSLSDRAQRIQRQLAVRHTMTDSLEKIEEDDLISDLIRKIPLPEMNDKAKTNFVNRLVSDPDTPFTSEDRPVLEKRFNLRDRVETSGDNPQEDSKQSVSPTATHDRTLPPTDETEAEHLIQEDSQTPLATETDAKPPETDEESMNEQPSEQEATPTKSLTNLDDSVEDDTVAESPSPDDDVGKQEGDTSIATDNADTTQSAEEKSTSIDAPQLDAIAELSIGQLLEYAMEIEQLDVDKPTEQIQEELSELCEEEGITAASVDDFPAPKNLSQHVQPASD